MRWNKYEMMEQTTNKHQECRALNINPQSIQFLILSHTFLQSAAVKEKGACISSLQQIDTNYRAFSIIAV